jgi:hypothetical protein
VNLTSVVGSAAPWRIRELTRLDAQVRVSRPVAVRVAVLGVTRDVGTSVAAGLTASVLASRGHRVLAVNASRPGKSLLWHTGLPPQPPAAPEDDDRRAAASTFAGACEGLPRATSGVYCMELADSFEARWRHVVAPVTRFFDYTITDWGTRSINDLAAIASAATIVAVVAPAERPLVQQAVDIAGAIGDTGAIPIVVVTDPKNTWNPAWSELLKLLPFPAAHIAYDTAHGEDRPRSSRRLPDATRLSGLRLAAAITTASTAVSAEGTIR